MNAARRPLIVGNWKMHKTVAETRAFIAELLAANLPEEIDLVVAPPFTALGAAHEALAESTVALGAQTMHEGAQGPFTGEISPVMLLELGVTYVILGHSERRLLFGESDAWVNSRVRSAIAHGITPIVAVGETSKERQAGQTDRRVIAQTVAALDGLDATDAARVVMAYEPIWAIGTGANCDPVEANRVMGEIRKSVGGLNDVPILYGGSMKPENVASYAQQPDINGGLVGGASLDPVGFAALIEAAARHA